MVRKRTLKVEQLEDRAVPALFGLPWTDPNHLSISLAPDGTGIASHESNLYATLDGQLPDTWQQTILTAFQNWAAVANIDFGYRVDEGLAFGTPGLVQGDPRFGDIRVGAHAMSPEVLAIAIPPDPTLSGTWTGDVLLNSNHVFDGDPYSLLAVMMHEAGHTLGLDNSLEADAIMYSLYNATRTSLSVEDISRIQALYGVRAADRFEGSLGNNTRGRATSMPTPTGYKGETPLVAFGDITTQTDVDFYKFTFPDDGNDDQHDRRVTIRLQTEGVSLMAPRLTILDATGRVLARVSSQEITGDTLQLTLTGLSTNQTYFVKVQSARGDVFGVGRYGLSVRLDNTSGTSDQVIDRLLSGPYDGLDANAIDAFFRSNGDALLDEEFGANDTLSSSVVLTARPGYAPGTRFEAVASLSKKEDVDFYRLVAPAGEARTLTASVWTADRSGFQPRIAVVNASGQQVPSTILVNGDGTSTVQLTNTVAGQTYYLRVSQSEDASPDKGNYLVSGTFGARSVQLQTFATNSLNASRRTVSTQLYVAQTQLFHYVLTAGTGDPGSAIRFTLRDASGTIVASLRARSGETVSTGSVLLRPGPYTATFEIENPNGASVTYWLRGGSQSNPIGPVLSDPTLNPQYTSPPPPANQPPYYAYPGFSVPYNPAVLPGYVVPGNPATYPPGFTLPPEMAQHPWLIVTTDPFAWIPLVL